MTFNNAWKYFSFSLLKLKKYQSIATKRNPPQKRQTTTDVIERALIMKSSANNNKEQHNFSDEDDDFKFSAGWNFNLFISSIILSMKQIFCH